MYFIVFRPSSIGCFSYCHHFITWIEKVNIEALSSVFGKLINSALSSNKLNSKFKISCKFVVVEPTTKCEAAIGCSEFVKMAFNPLDFLWLFLNVLFHLSLWHQLIQIICHLTECFLPHLACYSLQKLRLYHLLTISWIINCLI